MSEPLPVSSPAPEAEVDFLAPLKFGALVRIAACTAVCGALGFTAGKVILKHAQSKAVVRIATIAMLGPALSPSEVKARGESHGETVEDLTALGAADPAKLANAYRFDADMDTLHAGDVVTLTVDGPDAATAHALMQKRVESLVTVSHQAYAAAQKLAAQQLGGAVAVAGALTKDGASADPAEAASYERWAGQLLAARRDGQRALVVSRDTEVIDPPYEVESNARAMLLCALGCFGGLLLGLALTARSKA